MCVHVHVLLDVCMFAYICTYLLVDVLSHVMYVCAAVHGLLRAIYNIDELTDEIRARDVAEHVTAAVHQQRIVPLTMCLLLARRADGSPLTVDAARALLDEEPIFRKLVMKLLAK